MIACPFPCTRAAFRRLFVVSFLLVELTAIGRAQAGASIPSGGLRLWLRADQGVETSTSDLTRVTRWLDQSGLNNHAIASYPHSAPRLLTEKLTGTRFIQFDVSDYVNFSA